MPETEIEKKKRKHEGMVCGYLPPYLRKKYKDYISDREVASSEIVVEGIILVLQRDGIIPKKNL